MICTLSLQLFCGVVHLVFYHAQTSNGGCMVRLTFMARVPLAVLILGMATACATQRSDEELALQRAYDYRVCVTGSRLCRRVDPVRHTPEVGYRVTTFRNDDARDIVRAMSAPGPGSAR
jgi:hypothetical protein